MDRVLLAGAQVQALTSLLATLDIPGSGRDVSLNQESNDQNVIVLVYSRPSDPSPVTSRFKLEGDGYTRDLGDVIT